MNPDWSLSFPIEPAILGFMPSSPENKSAEKRATAPTSSRTSARASPSSAKPAKQTRESDRTQTANDDALQAEDNSALHALLDQMAGSNKPTSDAALAHFYDLTVSRVYGVALRIVRTPALAEEVTSDIYLQVWRDAARYDESRGRVMAWLLIITRSRALDLLRRQDEAFSHPDPQMLIAEPESARDDPQNLLSATQSNAKLHAAFQSLTPLQRQLLSLAFFRGLTHTEIVVHIDMPLGSVKTHIRRALTVLRDALDGALDRTLGGAPEDTPT